ncbi:MAG: diacylglycerol kinase family lipid kinase [Bryobacteraceae bacterium]|nr:diacylglycerol kinase family lipid kinase [Bryobacteraceae bacterium]
MNPRSAGGRAGKRWNELREALARRIGSFEVCFTERQGHGAELTRRLIERGCERIAGIGGDGTINEIANGMLEAGGEARIGILPFGTGGDLRRTLAIPRKWRDAMDVLADGRTLEIDAGKVAYLAPDGRARSRYFVNLVSFGMGGEVAAHSNNVLTPLGGRAAFLYASAVKLLAYRGRRVELALDGGSPLSHKVLNVAVGNGRYHGGGMHVCPEAVLDDGLLEVTVIEDLGLLTLARDLSYLYDGRILAHPKVRHFRARSVRATSPEITRIEVDGEALGSLPVEITILPKRLKVLAP